MALSVAISFVSPASGQVAGQVGNYLLTISSAATDAAQLITGMQVYESTESDAQVSQPNFLIPNLPQGISYPTLLPGTSLAYPFQAIFNSPSTPGESPNAPGGGYNVNGAMQNVDANFGLVANVQFQSGSTVQSVASANSFAGSNQPGQPFLVAVSAVIQPFPPPLGGVFQFNSGANLLIGLCCGVL